MARWNANKETQLRYFPVTLGHKWRKNENAEIFYQVLNQKLFSFRNILYDFLSILFLALEYWFSDISNNAIYKVFFSNIETPVSP